jgi:hypothetical protein
MIKNMFKALMDIPAYILGDVKQQSPVMWVFIGWGWLCILIMLTSLVDTII